MNSHRAHAVGLALLAMLTATTAGAASQTYEVAKKSNVGFVAKITASSFVAKSSALTGTVTYDAQSGILEAATVKVRADSFETGMDLRDEHMRDNYLEAEKHPFIVFEAEKSRIDSTKGSMSVLGGAFIIKDVRKPTKLKVKVMKSSENELTVMSKFKLDITDYGIPQPKFTVVKMETVIRVTLELHLKPKS